MAAKTKRLVVGNWKMYVERLDEARALISALKRKSKKFTGVEVWVAPPAPFVSVLAHQNSNIRIGAQSSSPQTEGAHTGEVSAAMLKDAGATFVIVGHSERRSAGESDGAVNQELPNVLQTGMFAVLCVGEQERDEHGGHFAFIENQLRSALAGIKQGSKLIIAYEPVWAIGRDASSAARPEVVREVVIFIRKTLVELFGRSAALRVPILYGGSVEGENASVLIESADIDGFLVGHASADAIQFVQIIAACNTEVSLRTHKVKRKKNVKLKSQNAKSKLKKKKLRSNQTF